eukprot:1970940-Pyramimonas_sp.AAC.1
MATDVFNIAFASVQEEIEAEMEMREIRWLPTPSVRVFSSAVEHDEVCASVSFVDDLTPSVASPDPAELLQMLGELIDIVFA